MKVFYLTNLDGVSINVFLNFSFVMNFIRDLHNMKSNICIDFTVKLSLFIKIDLVGWSDRNLNDQLCN